MEAVPRLPMISFDLKVSPDRFPPEFVKLKQYIRDFYNEDPDTYSTEIRNLETLRANAIHPAKDATGCAVLKKYFCQLHFLQSRFPIGRDEAVSIPFVWKDAYGGVVSNTPDIKFEMVNILYNIGALHSQLGAADDRSTPEGLKMACTHLQCAAWAFQHLKDSFPQPTGLDISPDLMQFMYQMCLAQAQECILEKSMTDNRKATINAKVAAQIVDYYNLALNALLQGPTDDGSIMDIVGSKLFKSWKKYMKFKVSYYSCISLLYQGMQSEEQQKMGERIAYYQGALDKLNDAVKLSKGLDYGEVSEALIFTRDVVEGKRKAAKNENDFIYHEDIPELDTLPIIKGASLVKGIPFNVNDPEISGPDIFSRLVPMKAHEVSSLYSEEKAKLLRRISSMIDTKDEEVVSYMSSLQLDYLRAHLDPGPILPQEVIDRCAALSAKPDAIPNLIEAMDQLSDAYHDVDGMLREVMELIKIEEASEKEYQEIMGSRPPSIVATDLTREANKYMEAHKKAAESNETLHKAMTQHIENLRVLQRPLDEIANNLPTLDSVNLRDDPTVNEVIMLVDKIGEMRKQRGMLASQLRESICSDDITSQLVTRTDEKKEDIFEKEMQKHNKYVSLIEQNLAAQENIIPALTDAYAKYAGTRKAVSEIMRQREMMLSALISSCDAYEDLITKSNKGLEFYRKLETNLTKLLQRVKGTCKVQQEERDSILAQHNKKLEQSIGSTALPTTSSSSGGGLKLKDYLQNRKTSQPAASTYYPGQVGSTDGQQTWLPSVRPAPLGSEGTSSKQLDYTPATYDGASSGMGLYNQLAYGTDYAKNYMMSYNYQNPLSVELQNLQYPNLSGSGANPAVNSLSSPSPKQYSQSIGNQYPYSQSAGTSYSNYDPSNPVPTQYSSAQANSQYTSAQSSQSDTHATSADTSLQQYSNSQYQYPQTAAIQNYQNPAIAQSFVSTGQSYASPNGQAYGRSGGHQNYPSVSQSYQNPVSQSYQSPTTQSYVSPTTESIPIVSNQNYPSSSIQNYQGLSAQNFQTPMTQTYQTSTMTPSYQTSTAQNYQTPTAQSYQTPTAQSYQTSTAQSYQTPTTQSYQTPTAQSYQTPTTQSYQTSTAQSYQTPTTQSYQTSTAQSYQTPTTQSYQTPTTQSYQEHITQNYPTSTTPSYHTPVPLSYQTPSIQSNQTATVQSYRPLTGQDSQTHSNQHYQAQLNHHVQTPRAQSNQTSTQSYLDSASQNYSNPVSQHSSQPQVSGTGNAADQQYIVGSTQNAYSSSIPTYDATAQQLNSAYQTNIPYNNYSGNYHSSTSEWTQGSYPYNVNDGTYATNQAYSGTVNSSANIYSNSAATDFSQNVAQPDQSSFNKAALADHDYYQNIPKTLSAADYSKYIGEYSNTYPNVQFQGTPGTATSHYSNAGGKNTSETNSSSITPEGLSYASQYVASTVAPEYHNYYHSPYGYQQGGAPPNEQPKTDSAQPAPTNHPNSLTYIQASNNGMTMTYSQQQNGTIPSTPEVQKQPSNLDLLTGLDFTVTDTLPLQPIQQDNKLIEQTQEKMTNLTIEPKSSPSKNVSSIEINDKTKQSTKNGSTNSLDKIERPSPSKTPLKDPFSDPEVLSQFVQEVEKFEKFVEGLNSKTLNGPTPLDIKWNELQDLQEKDAHKQIISVARCYPMKNRFADFLPYDKSRVELPSTKDDYINASHVQDLRSYAPNFIMTQAPLPSTFADFWTMVIEQHVEIIVCLQADTQMNGEIYWAVNKTEDLLIGKIKVSLQSLNVKQHWVERILSVSDGKTSRVVIHLQFTSWPHSWMPESPSPFLSLVKEAESVWSQQRGHGPMVVHCDSGVGRSGLFVLLTLAAADLEASPHLPDPISLAVQLAAFRKNPLRDRAHLDFTYHCILYHARDLLMKRGVLASRSTFEEKRPKTKSHTRHPSEDFLLNSLNKDTNEEWKQSDGSSSGSVQPSLEKDPLSELDPLWQINRS